MTGNEIRKAFIEFFHSKGHKEVRSSSLVPHNDPTILFTNAGMNQFKDYFLGNEIPDFTTAVTSQKVMRAGGKHNDLENVGRTDRHHTFFEMLGNFSFGDYFKREAIQYAWEFLTKVMNVDPTKLAISVFQDDDESYDIWHNEIGIPAERIAKLGEKDNFWSMGDTGPCGPCSEIHYHLHPLQKGRTPKESLEADDDSFLEIWNLVFMQYNRDASGEMTPLPKPSIDTGMGLERIVSVVQGKNNNYDTDLLHPLCDAIGKGANYTLGTNSEGDVSCRVIADHMRAVSFLIADGVIPSNEGRGYVMRRIIRRAARHGKELGYAPGFLADLSEVFIPMMSDAYPELEESKGYIRILLEQEEGRFSATLHQGMRILDELLEEAKGQTNVHGSEIFKLYDTFGFPPDLANDILEDRGFSYDQAEFDIAMTEQRNRAKNAHDSGEETLKVAEQYVALVSGGLQSEFVGYEQLEANTEILAILEEGHRISSLTAGAKVEVVLSKSPFYAEGGGQVGDIGEISNDSFSLKVTNTISPAKGLIVAQVEVLSVAGSKVEVSLPVQALAKVDVERRRAIEANHSSTHLLQAAMRTVIGDHVKQAGSLVNEEKLRFDFSHYAPLTKEQIKDVESLVNKNIRANAAVTANVMDFDTAIQTGAMAIFGEKYGDDVRVVAAGEFSKEFCGGCHVNRTGDIGLFKITTEQAISSGIRRIEAATGAAAFDFVQGRLGQLESMAQSLKVGIDDVAPRLETILDAAKEKEKELSKLQKELSKIAAKNALEQMEEVAGTQFLALAVSADADLKSEGPNFLSQMKSGVLVLHKVDGDKVAVMVMVSKDLTSKYQAGTFVKEFASLVNGRGGGKPDFAQCGGTEKAGIPKFVEAVKAKLAEG